MLNFEFGNPWDQANDPNCYVYWLPATIFFNKEQISESHNSSQPKQHTPEETEQVNKRMKINWLTFLFRKNMYNLWSLKIFSFCAVWRINTWELKALSLQLPFLDNSEAWCGLQCLLRKPIKLIKFLFQLFSMTYRIGSLYLIIRPYNVKKEAHRKYIRYHLLLELTVLLKL